PRPTAIELKTKLVRLGLHHFDNRCDGLGRSSGSEQIPLKRVSERRQDAGFLALAVGGGACGEEQATRVHAIVSESIAQDEARFERGRHGEEIFVCLEDKRFWDGEDFARKSRTQSQSAGSEIAAAEAEIVCIRSAIQTEATDCIGLNHALRAVVERF